MINPTSKLYFIVGAGTRVTRDLLPALSIQDEAWDQKALVLRQSERPIVDFPSVLVTHDETKFVDSITTGALVFIAAPRDTISPELLQRIIDSPAGFILFDTPSSGFLELRFVRNLDGIRCFSTEESGYLPWVSQIRDLLVGESGLSVILFYKLFFWYHGRAACEAVSSRNLRSKEKKGLAIAINLFNQKESSATALVLKFGKRPSPDAIVFTEIFSVGFLHLYKLKPSALRSSGQTLHDPKKDALALLIRLLRERQESRFPTLADAKRHERKSFWTFMVSLVNLKNDLTKLLRIR